MPKKSVDPHIIECDEDEWTFVSEYHRNEETFSFRVTPPHSWKPYIQLLDKNGDPWKKGPHHAWLVYPVLKAGPKISIQRKLLAPFTLTELPFGPKHLLWRFQKESLLFKLQSYKVLVDEAGAWCWEVFVSPEKRKP